MATGIFTVVVLDEEFILFLHCGEFTAHELILSMAPDEGDFEGIDLLRSISSVTARFFVLNIKILFILNDFSREYILASVIFHLGNVVGLLLSIILHRGLALLLRPQEHSSLLSSEDSDCPPWQINPFPMTDCQKKFAFFLFHFFIHSFYHFITLHRVTGALTFGAFWETLLLRIVRYPESALRSLLSCSSSVFLFPEEKKVK